MREFFITWLDRLAPLLVILLLIGIAGGAVMAGWQLGLAAALAVLLLGGLEVLLAGGVLFVFLAIYRNTERTLQLLERIAAQKAR